MKTKTAQQYFTDLTEWGNSPEVIVKAMDLPSVLQIVEVPEELADEIKAIAQKAWDWEERDMPIDVPSRGYNTTPAVSVQ